ncbi:MAG: alpha/beta hydrolase [Gemmatimonadaceae bacterium]|nr:alpha/beta hydrolase [Gemmatimonadaceae bacterium]
MSAARDRYLAFRRALPPLPALSHETVRVRGLDLAVFRTPTPAEAAGPPLVCINGGLLFSHQLLWPMLSPLAARRALVFYDQRGRGRSSAPPGVRAARIEHDAGDVPALCDALSLEQVDLLGHSWGGGIAMLAAAQLGARTRRLVLANAVGTTSAWLPPLHEIALARLSGETRARLATFDPADLTEPDLERQAAYARAFYPAWFADRAFGLEVTPPTGTSTTGAVIAARLRRDGYDWRETVRGVRARTLVLHGMDDAIPVATALETAAQLGDVTSVETATIAGAGHLPFLEQPTRFFALVDGFLGGG